MKRIFLLGIFSLIILFSSLNAYAIPPYSSEIRYKPVLEKESVYNNIVVYYSDKDKLVMGFKSKGTTYSETEIDLSDPLNLTIEYTRLFMSTLFFVPEPKNILIIGLGAGAMSNFLQNYYPETNIDMIEIDGEVVKISREYFGMKESKQTKVHVQDGRVFVKRTKKKYDIVFLDAFRGSFVPFHLKTKEFYKEIKKKLAPNGVVASNLFGGSALYPYDVRTFSEVYKNLYSFKGQGNVILVAGNDKAVVLDDSGMEESAKKLMTEKKFNFDFGYIAESYFPLKSIDKNLDVFTDDFAPVNFINSVKDHNQECFVCQYDTRK
jgi:spermidine synthase